MTRSFLLLFLLLAGTGPTEPAQGQARQGYMKTETIQALLGGWDRERAQALLSWLAPYLEQAKYPVIDGVSFRPWGEVAKEELPEVCFLVRGEAGKRTDLALPVWEPDYSSEKDEEGRYTGKGPLNAAGVTAAWTAVNSGSRGNPPMDVPESIKEELEELKEEVDEARAKRSEAAQSTQADRASEILCLLQEEADPEQVWPLVNSGPHELTQTVGNLLLQAVEDTADLTKGTGSYRAQAVLTVADVLNNNQPPQRYSRQTWEAALPSLLQAAERGQLVGELMHPPGGQSDIARQCLRYRNLRWTETTHPQQGRVPALQGEVEIIPTEAGRTLIVQARNKFPIGFSSRGWGEEKWVQQEGQSGHYEIENFVCRTFDAVPLDRVASPGSTILYQAIPDTAPEPRTVATFSREIAPMKEAIQALLQALSEKGQDVSQWQSRLAELGEDDSELNALQQEVEAVLSALPEVTLDQATDGPVTVNVNLPGQAAPAPAVDLSALEQTILARLQAEGWTRPTGIPEPVATADASYLRQAALETRRGQILQEIEDNVEPAFRPALFQQMGLTEAGSFTSGADLNREDLDARFTAAKSLAQSFGTWKPRPAYGRGVQMWVKDPTAGVPRTGAEAIGELVQYAVDRFKLKDKGLRKTNVEGEFGPGPGGHEAWRVEVLQQDDRAAKLQMLLQNSISPSTPYGGYARRCLGEYIQVRQGRPLFQAGETTASDITVGPFMVFPMVVSAFPQIILTEIADTQPLDREVGTIFYRKVLNTSGQDLSDITYWTSTYADYSNESTLGAPSKIQLSITSTTVTATDRAFYIDASLKALNRLQAYHNLDGMMLAVEDMATQVALSINFSGLGQMVAGVSGTTAQTFGTAPASGYDGQDWIRDMFSRYIDRTSAEIAMKRHGPATDIICGSEDEHWFENLNDAGFEAAPGGPEIGEFAQGIRFAGMIRKKYRVWSVAWWENLPGLKVYGGNSQMLLSRKGPQFGDCAFVYAPYVQQTTPELTLPSSMSKQIGVFDQTAMSVVNGNAMALLTLAKGTTGTAI